MHEHRKKILILFLGLIFIISQGQSVAGLKVLWLPVAGKLVVDALDLATGEPVSGLPIEFYENGELIDTVSTNSTGTTVKSWAPLSNIVYNITVTSPENVTLRAANASFILDLRTPTSLSVQKGDEVIEDGEYIDVDTYETYTFKVKTSPPLSNSPIEVYVDRGSIQFFLIYTNSSGWATFDWWTDSPDVYFFRVVFEGDTHHKPCEFRFAAQADLVIPVSLNFSVSPEEFVPGKKLSLWARAVNSFTGSPIENITLQFFNRSIDGKTLIDELITNETGEVSTSWTYPEYMFPDEYKAQAVMVEVKPGKAARVKHIASRPATLEVGIKTRLELGVMRNYYSTGHVIYGTLLSESGSGLGGRVIKIWVNETEYSVRTSSTEIPPGDFRLFLDLQPRNDNATTYNITAIFEGEDPKNATAYATLPDGTQYPVCTTIQYYDFKPSSNSTWLTVEPQATEAVTQTKTPEQMQQEAQQSGRLRVEHKFSPWYPWYRMHFISVFNGEDVLDVGLSLIGNDIIIPALLFDSWINDFLKAVTKAIVIGYVGAEIAVLAAMQFGPQAFALTLLISAGVKWGLLSLAWNSIQDLKSIFIGVWVSFILGLVGVIKMLHSGLVSLARDAITAANAATLWKFLYKFIYIPINMIFVLLTLNRLSELGGI